MKLQAPAFELGKKVRISSEHFEQQCEGVVQEVSREIGDTCWVYRVIVDGDALAGHRDENGDLWINEFEISR